MENSSNLASAEPVVPQVQSQPSHFILLVWNIFSLLAGIVLEFLFFFMITMSGAVLGSNSSSTIFLLLAALGYAVASIISIVMSHQRRSFLLASWPVLPLAIFASYEIAGTLWYSVLFIMGALLFWFLHKRLNLFRGPLLQYIPHILLVPFLIGGVWCAYQYSAHGIWGLLGGASSQASESGLASSDDTAFEAVSTVTPEFIEYDSDHFYSGRIAIPTLLHIKNEAGKILLGDYYAPGDEAVTGGDVALVAVAPHYLIASVLSGKDTGSALQVIDIERKTASELPGHIEFTVGSVAVIFTLDNIYTYRLDTPKAVPVQNAKLLAGETYDHCGGCLGSPEVIETHTATSSTVSVWQFSGAPDYVRHKVRDFTFSIPN